MNLAIYEVTFGRTLAYSAGSLRRAIGREQIH